MSLPDEPQDPKSAGAEVISIDEARKERDTLRAKLTPLVKASPLERDDALRAIAKESKKKLGELRKELTHIEKSAEGAKKLEESEITIVAKLVKERPIVRGADSRVFARFENQFIPVDSGQFITKIAALYLRQTKAYTSPAVIEKVLLPINEGAKRSIVPVRCGYGKNNDIWIDVGDKDPEHFIHITADGVTVVEGKCPLAFFRSDGMQPLTLPELPVDDTECTAILDGYRTYLRLSREQFAGVFVFQVGALRPMQTPGEEGFTEYVELNITAPSNTGKTVMAENLRAPVDPKSPSLSGLPTRADDIAISGEQSRLLAYDNVGSISPTIQDVLCRRATGDGSEKRAHYTNRDKVTLVGSNPVIVTSIAGAITAPDLLSRCITLNLAPTTETKRGKRQLHANLKSLIPRVVGALCYCISRALRDLDKTEAPSEIRMQDSAQWAIAAGSAAGITKEEMISAFAQSMRAGDDQILEHSLMHALLRRVSVDMPLPGTMKEILDDLTEMWEERDLNTGRPSKRLPDDWPRSPEKFAAELKKLRPTLEREGFIIERLAKTNHGWNHKISRRLPPKTAASPASGSVGPVAGANGKTATSQVPETKGKNGKSGSCGSSLLSSKKEKKKEKDHHPRGKRPQLKGTP